MDSIDLPRLERRARWAYERARLVRAVVGALPLVAVVAVAAAVSRRPGAALAFGGCVVVLGAALLWRGQALQRAVLPGALAGAVPLVLALVANATHPCSGGQCAQWCLRACVAGGLTAGFTVSVVGLRRGLGLPFWAGASTLSLLTGAMGCACIGSSGVVGLAVGLSVGLLPPLGYRALARG